MNYGISMKTPKEPFLLENKGMFQKDIYEMGIQKEIKLLDLLKSLKIRMMLYFVFAILIVFYIFYPWIKVHMALDRMKQSGTIVTYEKWKNKDVNFIDKIVSLHISDSDVSHRTIVELKNFPDLYQLYLSKCLINAAQNKNETFSNTISYIQLSECNIKSMPFVFGLPKLRGIQFDSNRINSNVIKELKGLPIEELYLSNTNISDNDCRYIASMNRLSTLALTGLKITDNGIKFLRNNKRIYYLRIENLSLSNESVKYISSMPNMYRLYLKNIAITSQSLKHLAKLTNLEILELSGTNIDDRGLKYLTEISSSGDMPLKNIERLNLSKTKITDKSIDYIVKFKRLKDLDIRGTLITAKGYERLQKKFKFYIDWHTMKSSDRDDSIWSDI